VQWAGLSLLRQLTKDHPSNEALVRATVDQSVVSTALKSLVNSCVAVDLFDVFVTVCMQMVMLAPPLRTHQYPKYRKGVPARVNTREVLPSYLEAWSDAGSWTIKWNRLLAQVS
jgi:hypothetical protein